MIGVCDNLEEDCAFWWIEGSKAAAFERPSTGKNNEAGCGW
jgi:hypothetical protein